MPNRLVSVGDDFTLPAAVVVADANLPAHAKATALAAKQDAATLDAAVTAKITTPGSAVAGALSATNLTLAKASGFSDPSTALTESFKTLKTKIARAKPNARPTIRVVGFGPSIMVGGDVTNPATEGPLPLFVSAIKAALDPLATCDWVSVNLGINGSVSSQWLAPLQAEVTANGAPDIAYGVPGMNDFVGAQWHRSQTYDVFPGTYGFLSEMRKIFDYLNGLTIPVVVATSPHAHPTRTPNGGGLATGDRAGISYPGTDIYQWPGYPGPESPTVTLPNGKTAVALSRFKVGNDGLRAVAAEKGAICLDAELLFLTAVSEEGYDALYNTAQYNHPNTHGIELSYGESSRGFARALTNTRIQVAKPPTVSSGLPYSVYAIVGPGNTARTGTTTLADDPNLKFTAGANQTWLIEAEVHYSTPTTADAKFGIGVPASTAGRFTVTGHAITATTFDSTVVARSWPISAGAIAVGGNGTDGVASITATVRTGATAGTVAIQWAQNTSDAGNTVVYADSTLRATRIV